MLYLFDLDGTLIEGYMDRPDRAYEPVELLPKRRARIQTLILRGDTCAIVTNQAGVAFGYVAEAQAWGKIEAAMQKLGFLMQAVRSSGDPAPPLVYVCFHHPNAPAPWNDPAECARRKPGGAMLLEAVRDHYVAARLGVLYVGDREEDEQAAQAAGVPFQWAHVFFRDETHAHD